MYYRSPIRLPRELASVVDVHIGDKYRHIADKHAATIGSFFDNDQNCRSTNGDVRKVLVDHSFISDDIAGIAAQYDADIVELTIFRLQETDRRSDRGQTTPSGDGWVSELWHSDNYPPDAFKILVYLTDVGDEQGPFEYKIPVEYVPSNHRNSWRETRYAYDGAGTNVTGPPGTTVIFKNNIVHKGNYCRDGFRDVVMIGLRLPGSYRRAERVLRKLLRRRPQAVL
ncbi:MAG: hypothetical protein O7B81_14660 [Gammaproteobacteria bacterium]|nr:hypothetical protein [Gammaproteobacteria bacterium]